MNDWPVERETLARVATELLGWTPADVQPGEKGFEHVATPLEGWRHPDGTTSYGSGTLLGLLSGNGMMDVLGALSTTTLDHWEVWCDGYHPLTVELHAPDFRVTGSGATLPEAIARAANAYLSQKDT